MFSNLRSGVQDISKINEQRFVNKKWNFHLFKRDFSVSGKIFLIAFSIALLLAFTIPYVVASSSGNGISGLYSSQSYYSKPDYHIVVESTRDADFFVMLELSNGTTWSPPPPTEFRTIFTSNESWIVMSEILHVNSGENCQVTIPLSLSIHDDWNIDIKICGVDNSVSDIDITKT